MGRFAITDAVRVMGSKATERLFKRKAGSFSVLAVPSPLRLSELMITMSVNGHL